MCLQKWAWSPKNLKTYILVLLDRLEYCRKRIDGSLARRFWLSIIRNEEVLKNPLSLPSVGFLVRSQQRQYCKSVPPIHKRHPKWCFPALLDAISYQKCLNWFMVSFQRRVTCNGGDTPDIFKSIPSNWNSELYLCSYRISNNEYGTILNWWRFARISITI